MADAGVLSRSDDQHDFMGLHGWGQADVVPLIPDASFRSYKRLNLAGEQRMLMDAPPSHENIDAFLDITAHLRGLGLRVAEVYAEDRKRGFAMIEDLGDDTFTRLLAAGTDRTTLYLIATDILVHLHGAAGATDITLAPYDMPNLSREAALFVDWFVPAVRGEAVSRDERQEFLGAFEEALAGVAADRRALVLRDYHVDNLMIVGGRFEMAHCALLDYQDALIGSPAYDLISLVEDARCDIPADVREAVLARYFKGRPEMDRDAFLGDMTLLGAQRSAKIAGIFVRLSRRDNKHVYLKHIPRVVNYIDGCLKAPALQRVRKSVLSMLPDYPNVSL
ncbi:aminoglycoside phosphotransferase family protein [Kordiimonas gwangyangensis]|uniref:aminoglycoside phosphotransferase family protein n=1 Tax=Kordiimonas gwangyangensis TaxID=288022 RepID=UPI000367DF07|nr:phosphotransferase [Kordiimonas gwangyangensis]